MRWRRGSRARSTGSSLGGSCCGQGCIDERRLVAELDGYAHQGHRGAFETDRERDIVLAAAGHRTVRVTDHQLTTQHSETAERFTALLSAPT